ncbi:MAG: AsmA-like C-terminal region-containing protein [Isosphaeraceae bacterium]
MRRRRFWRRLVKVIGWGLVLCVLIAAGLAWFAYTVVTDSDTASRLIKAQAARFFPRSIVDMGQVDVLLLRAGQVKVPKIHLHQRIDGKLFDTAFIPWLSVQLDPRLLVWHGKFEFREVIVSQPTLRLCRRRDGTWNLQGLIANPWPGPALKNPPPIVIRNGTVELFGVDEPEDSSTSAIPAGRKPQRDARVIRSGQEGGQATTARKSALSKTRAGSKPRQGSSQGRIANAATAAAGQGVAILRDVSLRIEPDKNGCLHFDGSARGDLFRTLNIQGSINPATGSVSLGGELAGLTISENLRRRLPPEIAPAFDALALTRGEVDLQLRQISYDPAAPADQRLHYDIGAQLHGGAWECPQLPFPVNDLVADMDVQDNLLTIKHAEGSNGTTILRASGKLAVAKGLGDPFDLQVDLIQLELDKRIQECTPPQYYELWDVFKPHGQIDAYIHLVRERGGDPVGVGATVICRDVATTYRHFPYPLEHVSGRLTLEGQTLSVELHGLVGERPAVMKGTIVNPGPDAIVELQIDADSVPIDDVFLGALRPRPEILKVVSDFHPSGSIKASVHVKRKPLCGPRVKEEGCLVIDAYLDLNPRCEITWVGLPYSVRNLTGQLELHPDRWIFKKMRGRNGQAVITGSGRVQKLPGPKLPGGEPPLKIDLDIQAQNLPFDDNLRRALQPAWRKTWSIINPMGTSDVTAEIHVMPGQPEVNHITITPRQESSVKLVIDRTPMPGVDQGGTIELKMENVRGRFDFDNGKVQMSDVNFLFHDAPVQFESGDVVVEDSGRFALNASDLWVRDIRFDTNMQRIMPKLMGQFAQRLDDGKPFTARGNLKIGWSGVVGQPAWCRWDHTLVVLNDNSLKSGVPLEHIQGQLEDVHGWSDGHALEIHGIVNIASVSLMGQQITNLESPFHIQRGLARLEDLTANLLGGKLAGSSSISLDETPRYNATLRLTGARLEAYAQTIQGRQTFRGSLSAAVGLAGLGNDIHNLQGRGEAHIIDGELGELPIALRFLELLNRNLSLLDSPRTSNKTAFDRADVTFRIDHGTAILDPIKLTGNAISLKGKGRRDPLGNFDLWLSVAYGRDRFPLPVLSDLMREASSQILVVRMLGTMSNPRFSLEPLPQFKQLGERRARREE